MTPLAIFVLAASAVFVGTVSAAFSAMMRLSLRLAAERSDRDDLLGWYLDDPMRLFIPARIVLAIIYVVAGALLARVIAMQAGHGLPTLIAAMAVFALVCEHLVPLVLIRRDPEAVLGATLPAFQALDRLLRPVTMALLGLDGTRAVAARAGFAAANVDVGGQTVDGFFKADGKRQFDVRAALGLRAGICTSRAAAEKVAENIAEAGIASRALPGPRCAATATENTAPIEINAAGSSARAASCRIAQVFAVIAELVIHLAFFRIGQHIVRFGDLLEFFLRRLIAGIYVGMVFARQTAIRLADVIRRC